MQFTDERKKKRKMTKSFPHMLRLLDKATRSFRVQAAGELGVLLAIKKLNSFTFVLGAIISRSTIGERHAQDEILAGNTV